MPKHVCKLDHLINVNIFSFINSWWFEYLTYDGQTRALWITSKFILRSTLICSSITPVHFGYGIRPLTTNLSIIMDYGITWLRQTTRFTSYLNWFTNYRSFWCKPNDCLVRFNCEEMKKQNLYHTNENTQMLSVSKKTLRCMFDLVT